VAVLRGNKAFLEKLLSMGAKATRVFLLQLAATKGDVDMAELPLGKGESIAVKTRDSTPLHFAANHGAKE